jgi:hypothetical protein
MLSNRIQKTNKDESIAQALAVATRTAEEK